MTAGLGQALFEGQALVAKNMSTHSVPTLALHGGADELVPSKATEMLEGMPGVERRVLPDLRHEIFNEYGHEELIAEVIYWIRTGVASLP